MSVAALSALLLAFLVADGVRALDANPDAGLRLPTFIASHMVLQRFPARAALWGWANPGANVTVELIYGGVEDLTIRTGADAGGGAARTARRLRMESIEPFFGSRVVARAVATADAAGAWHLSLSPQPAGRA